MSARCLALLLAAMSLLAAGCARSSRQLAWDGEWAQALDADQADPATAERWAALAAVAPREVDAASAELARGDALLAAGDPAAAARVWGHLGEDAPLRPFRARAHYEIARLAEESGRIAAAVHIYRRLVLTYPDLMPGERALAHLERIFAARGPRGVAAHLAWTRAIYPRLQHTTLGDNLVFYPAQLAHRRFRATGDPAAAELAERLYAQIDEAHPGSGLWNDAWWQRSLLYHRMGRVDDEIRAIRRIQRTREKISLFGHDEHVYFWRGQIRIARLQLLELGRPAEAAASLRWFIDTYPDSIWRDDAIFWRACALLAAGDRAAGEAEFTRLASAYPESKYLAWRDDARADPRSARCVPKDFDEGQEP